MTEDVSGQAIEASHNDTMVSPSSTQPRRARLQLLDCFRFAAAAAVVAFHWLFRGIEEGSLTTVSYSGLAEPASYGYLGVHLFFMISGFVIAASAQGRTPSQFAVSRLVRLYPAFWVAVLFTSAVTLVWGGSIFGVTVPQVLANLTMGPNVFDQPLVDGSYWTLLHELLFYIMVFLFLIMGFGKWLDAAFPAWALIMMVITIAVPTLTTIPFMGTLYGFFAAGAIISTIQRRGWHWWQSLGLAATLYVVVAYTIRDVAKINTESRPFEQSLPITLAIVCSFYLLLLVQIIPIVSTWRIPRSALLGSLTYPVYLIHAHFGYMFLNQLADDSNRWVLYPLTLAVVVVLAYALHVFVERRPKKMWFRLFDVLAGTPIRWVEQRVKKPEQAPLASADSAKSLF
jgi:peptidoglycan/LPS O-acetylase OafA/YrhL